jgi:hypothetical protein
VGVAASPAPLQKRSSVRRSSLFGGPGSTHPNPNSSLICCLLTQPNPNLTPGSSTLPADGAEQLAAVTCVSKVKMERCAAVPPHLSKVRSFALLRTAPMPPNVYVACSKGSSLAILQVPPRPPEPVDLT